MAWSVLMDMSNGDNRNYIPEITGIADQGWVIELLDEYHDIFSLTENGEGKLIYLNSRLTLGDACLKETSCDERPFCSWTGNIRPTG